MRLAAAMLLAACGIDTLGELPPAPTSAPAQPVVPSSLLVRDVTIWSQGDTPWPDEGALAIGLGPESTYVSHRALVAVDNPPANATAWRLRITQASAVALGIVDVVRLREVNAGWTEDADWFHADHRSAKGWGGSKRGLGAIGVDFDAPPEPERPSFIYGPETNGVTHVVDLPLEWLAGPGLLLKARFDGGPDLFTAHSSESAVSPLEVEIDVSH